MTETILRDDIRAFAASVRARLDDLPADEVDDLLEGLEADLADQAAEAGDDFALPDAVDYAAELRAAAGLPERVKSTSPRRTLRNRWNDAEAAAARWVRSNPAIAAVVSFFVSLRPVWWVIRAAVLYVLLAPFIPPMINQTPGLVDRLVAATLSLPGLMTFGALLVLSIQWGRGRWAPVAWLRVVRRIISVVTALAAPFLFFTTIAEVQAAQSYVRFAGYENQVPGLAVDGQRVRNIFAYDAEGNPIDHVQLFDQNGEPLTTVSRSAVRDEVDFYFYGGGGPAPVPEREIGRQPVWNVFPLRELVGDAWTEGELDRDDAIEPDFPFAEVPALPSPSSTATSAEMTGVTAPTPEVTPSPAP